MKSVDNYNFTTTRKDIIMAMTTTTTTTTGRTVIHIYIYDDILSTFLLIANYPCIGTTLYFLSSSLLSSPSLLLGRSHSTSLVKFRGFLRYHESSVGERCLHRGKR